MKRIMLLAIWMSLFCATTLRAQEERAWSINVGGGIHGYAQFLDRYGGA